MLLPLRYYGDPVLRENGAPIEAVTDEIRALADDMIQTMRAEQGVGLAAQQIGRTGRICVVEVPPEYDVDEEGHRLHPDLAMPLVLVNPRITNRSEDRDTAEEGCLSFPKIVAPITRSCSIELGYVDREGAAREVQLAGFVARVVQHEVDHLNGVLFVDHMTPVKRVALAGRLKRMRKETLARLEEA